MASRTARTQHLGVLVGLEGEAALVRRALPAHLAVMILASGARASLARDAASKLVAAGVTHTMSFGFAAGLDGGLDVGAILLPEAIQTEDGTRLPVDTDWHRRLTAIVRPASTGPLLGVDRIVGEPREKSRLRAATGAVGLDMESHVMAEAAQANGLPFLCLRAVLDPADQALPPAVSVSLKPDGRLDVLALIRSLALRPSQIPGLIAVGRDAGKARRALLRCSDRCGPIGFGVC